MKTKQFLIFGLLVLALGLILAGCDTGSTNGGGDPGGSGNTGDEGGADNGGNTGGGNGGTGGGETDTGGGSGDGGGSSEPTTLVGKWYITQEAANAEVGLAIYEFTSNGTLLYGGMNMGLTYTASNGKITVKSEGYSEPGIVDYSITGTKLALNNPNSIGSIMYRLMAGTYYKKAP